MQSKFYFRNSSKSGRVTVYLNPSVLEDELSDLRLHFLLFQEFTVKFRSSLLSLIVFYTAEEFEDLIQSLDGSLKRREYFLTSKKKLKTDSNLSNLVSFFLFDVFQKVSYGSSFDELWPQLHDRILVLSKTVILLGCSLGLTTTSTTGDIKDLIVNVRLIQDDVGFDEDLTKLSLCSCWEGARFVNQTITELTSITLPLLDVKSIDLKLTYFAKQSWAHFLAR